jgi:hypothetical protein
MEQADYLHVIGLGSSADWEAGRGAIYHIMDDNGEKGLPVFRTAEGAERYGQANFNVPDAHMDMLESIPASHADLLTKGRYVIMPLDAEQLAKVVSMVEADYLIRDPRPGSEQEILRLHEK